eukprot:PhF_6_TR10203/c0_g1_i1/m.15820/K15544/SSU72; RNA polymerase II subunit A C-terminal domain phosphatase SSU72
MEVTVARVPSIPQHLLCLDPQWRDRIRVCIAATENSTLSVSLHEELLETHLPLDINSCSVRLDQTEVFSTGEEGSAVLSFPHYDMGYLEIAEALRASASAQYFEDNGTTSLVERSAKVKHHPECFWDLEPHMQWDVILCVEPSVYDTIVEYVMEQKRGSNRPVVVYVICIPTTNVKVFGDVVEELFSQVEEGRNQTNDTAAATGGGGGRGGAGWQDTVDDVVASVSERHSLDVLHLCWAYRG